MSNRRISGSRKMNGPAVKISSATLSDLTTLEAEGSRMKTKMGPALAAHSLSNQSCTQTDCDCFLNSELLSQSMEGDYSDSYSRRSRRFNSCKKTFADDTGTRTPECEDTHCTHPGPEVLALRRADEQMDSGDLELSNLDISDSLATVSALQFSRSISGLMDLDMLIYDGSRRYLDCKRNDKPTRRR